MTAAREGADRDLAQDREAVVRQHDALQAVRPDPVVGLDRAAAVAGRDGPAVAPARVQHLAGDDRLRRQPAAEADRQALVLVSDAPEERFLRGRPAEMTGSAAPG